MRSGPPDVIVSPCDMVSISQAIEAPVSHILKIDLPFRRPKKSRSGREKSVT